MTKLINYLLSAVDGVLIKLLVISSRCGVDKLDAGIDEVLINYFLSAV